MCDMEAICIYGEKSKSLSFLMLQILSYTKSYIYSQWECEALLNMLIFCTVGLSRQTVFATQWVYLSGH